RPHALRRRRHVRGLDGTGSRGSPVVRPARARDPGRRGAGPRHRARGHGRPLKPSGGSGGLVTGGRSTESAGPSGGVASGGGRPSGTGSGTGIAGPGSTTGGSGGTGSDSGARGAGSSGAMGGGAAFRPA